MKVLSDRAERLAARPGVLGGWCGACRQASEDLLRAEEETGAFVRRLGTRSVRLFFETLVLVVVGIAELWALWHRALNALAVPPKR